MNREEAIYELEVNIRVMQNLIKYAIKTEEIKHSLEIEIIKNELLIKDLEQWDKK